MKTINKHGILQRFGNTVRTFRKQLGISQEQLAERAGLHRTYIGSIERGEQNISLLNIEKVANALGISIATLLQDNQKHNKQGYEKD